MRKIIIYISSIITPLLLIPQLAFADDIGTVCNGSTGSFKGLCLVGNNLGGIIGSIVNLLFLVAGLIALIYLVIGGIKWITSEGDTKNVEAARNQIIAAAIGLSVTFLSYLIINVLMSFFGITGGLSNLTLPNITGK